MSSIANDEASLHAMNEDSELKQRVRELLVDIVKYKYSYNFTWLGRPIIQMPDDVLAIQELLWSVAPDVVVETGIAHGGSLILHASILQLLGGERRVVGVDIDIRAPNRAALDAHPLRPMLTLIEGSSIAPATVQSVRDEVTEKRALVILDSNHTHDHVLAELRAYEELVRKGSYLIVMDTSIADVPGEAFPERPWNEDNNPRTAVQAFLRETNRFEVDHDMDQRLLFTAARGGYLRCVRDPE